MKPIVEIFREVVEKVNISVLPQIVALDPKITGIHYEHGHPLEVLNRLKQKDQTSAYKFQIYPVIALFQDFPESSGDPFIDKKGTFHLIIAKGTRQEYNAQQRYEHNFKPFLYPIYDSFFEQLSLDKRIMNYGPESIKRDKFDRLFWGSNGLFGNTSNIFDNYLDVIEIKNLQLKFYKELC